MPSILIVDDETAIRDSLRGVLEDEGYEAAVAESGEACLEWLRKKAVDVILLDVWLPGMDGLDIIGKIREADDAPEVIMISGHGTIETAVRATKLGAFDFLEKPLSLERTLIVVKNAFEARKLRLENRDLKRQLLPKSVIVGESIPIKALRQQIQLMAPTNGRVLIFGESGTGKELVARAIHRHSLRRDRPFLPVHVAALNPGLVESELFGHVKGAFTGAAQSRPGLFPLAEGGTVFLDEVADIPLAVQVKLLRALEHNEILAVGSNEPQALNLRVLAATHQDLTRRVADGSFRHDLFFRLNVFQIHLPPLRERVEDIPLLAEHFRRRFEPQSPPLPADTVRFLQNLPWLGNVRELRNALEHAAIVARGGPLRPEHFPQIGVNPGPMSPSDQLAEAVRRWLAERIPQDSSQKPAELYAALLRCVEPPLFAEVIRRVGGNRWEAGRWLGLNRATVRKKLGEFGLENET